MWALALPCSIKMSFVFWNQTKGLLPANTCSTTEGHFEPINITRQIEAFPYTGQDGQCPVGIQLYWKSLSPRIVR